MNNELPKPSPEARQLHAGRMAFLALDALRNEQGGDCWCTPGPDKFTGHTWGCLVAQRAMEAREEV